MMLIFGGAGNHYGVVYTLDLTTMKWSCLKNVKYERCYHTANLIGNSIYLFGGWNDYCYFNVLHKYDVKSQTLQKAITSGNIPSVRFNHGSAVIEDNLYIFGEIG